MKRKLLFLAALVASALGFNANAQDCTAKVGTTPGDWGVTGTVGNASVTPYGASAPVGLPELYGSSGVGVKLQQTVKNLDLGVYEVTLFATSHNARGEDGASLNGTSMEVAYIFATTSGETSKKFFEARGVKAGIESDEPLKVTISDILVKDGSLTIGLGIEKEKQTGWHTAQIYQLTRTGDLPLDEYIAAYKEALAKAKDIAGTSKKVSSKVIEALNSAIVTYTYDDAESKDAATLTAAIEALTKATATAETSIASYEIIASGVVPTDVLDGWSSTNTNTLQVNTWSTEADNTGMVTPFIENWVNNASVLGNGKVSYTLEGIEPGEVYYAQALVRTYSEAGNVPNGPTFFINSATKDMTEVGTSFEYNKMKGFYGTLGGAAVVGEDGKITLGVEISGANYNWVAFKNVSIQDMTEALNTAIEKAKAAQKEKMHNVEAQALDGAIKAAEAEQIEDYEAVIQALQAAIENAEKSIAVYAATKASLDAYDTKAASLDKFGQAAYDVAEIKAAYEDGTMEEDQTAAIAAAFAVATKAQVTPGADFTGAIVNAECNSANKVAPGWTTDMKGNGGNGPTLNDVSLEYWAGNPDDGRSARGFDYWQEITGLPNGKYTVSAEMYNSLNDEANATFSETSGVYAKAGETEVIKLVDVAGETLIEYTTDEIEVTDGTLRIGVKNTDVMAARWFVADNFKLTLVELTMPELTNTAFDANPDNVITVNTYGYQRNVKDDGVAGLQDVEAWTKGVQNESDPGYVGGVFAYGSTNLLNDKVIAPATNPEGGNEGVALGLAAVWAGIAQYTQAVTFPAGNYVLTFTVYNGVNTAAVTKNLFGFIAEDGTEYLSEQANFTAVGEWQNIYVPFTLNKETTGKVSVGFIGSGGSASAPHLFVDNVSYAVVSDDGLAVAKAKAAKIAELNTKTITGEIDNYSVDKKLAAIAAAETVEDVEAVPAPAYIFTLTTSEGLQLNTESGIKIEEEGTPLSLIVQSDGKYALSPNEGEYINYDGNSAWALTTTSTAYGWTVALADGKYTITGKGDNGKNRLGTNDDEVTAGSTCWGDKNNENIYWTIAEYVPTVTVTEALYATYVTTDDVKFGDEVEAYIVSALNEDNTVAILTTITEAPAGTPVVIKAEKADTYELNIISKAKEVEGENLLKVATGTETGEGIYVLANINQVVGFYALEEGVKVPAGKAYLNVPAGGDIKFIGFEGNGDATGIQGVEDAAEVENGAIYNLAGQRVQNPTKGIYIVNGKKVLVK